MPCTVHLAWDDALTAYDFGQGHPLAPVRVELTMELARDLGVLSGISVQRPEPATDAELELVHDARYLAAVRRAGAGGPPALLFGLGTPDNPVFPGMHEASALVAGATLAAARAAWTGTAQHGASIGGGLHHAMRASASGFCVYNDPAIAIAWLLASGAERIAYVDIDVHHGDGVQAAFYDDPRVLTISLHETPDLLFPGTGRPAETGGPGARGSAVNVALPGGTGDAGWLRAFHAVVPPLLHAFGPQILVSQHGCDTHRLDPLADLALSVDGQRAAHAAIHQLAHEEAGGRWLLTGGGGYALVQVVPRTWTHLLAEAAGRPLDPATPTPGTWRAYVTRRTGGPAPELMTEGTEPGYVPFEAGFDPADPVDQAIRATRTAVFPEHGLTP
jgi:acetoin utilization protein AcuC